MDFEHSPRSRELQDRLLEFMDAHIYPNEHRFHAEIEAGLSVSLSRAGLRGAMLWAIKPGGFGDDRTWIRAWDALAKSL